MIRKLARTSVAHPRAVLTAVLVLALLALLPARSLPLDALPDLTTNQVVVLTSAPGRSPEEVELTVTRPIELALGGIAGVHEQRSTSRYGISSITAVFDDDVDPWRARQMVSERLLGIRLPAGASAPELAPLTGGLGEIYHLTVSSSTRSLTELLELSTLQLVPLLKAVPGVVEVNSWGGAQRTFDVVAKPNVLAARGLTLAGLRDAVRDATGVAAGGALASQGTQVLTRAEARPQSPADLASAVVGSPPIRIGEVAEVVEGKAFRLGAATSGGTGETVYLMVQMLRDQNALAVIDQIHARMPQLRATLPSDVRLEVVYDRSVLVRGTLQTVAKNLLEGGALVIAVLLAFLGSWRAGLIAASVIPLSMLLATAVMSLARWPGNLMSLGALDFGLLVDGAIVMVEGVFHGYERGDRASFRGHVSETAGRSAGPVFFSVLVIVLVYVPVLSLTGADGRLFRPMAVTVVIALGFALILSLTWVPALLSLFLRPEDVPQRPPLLARAVERLYPRVLARALGKRALVTVLSMLLLAVGGFVASRRGIEFTPQLDEGDMVVQTTRRPDISLDESIAQNLALERALVRVPEVTRAVSRIGSPAVATDLMGYEQADIFVGLKPREAWRAGLSRDALIREMHEAIEKHAPGGEPSFTQPVQMRFNELLGGAVTDVAISVYGEDLARIRQSADAIARALSGVHGAHEVRVLAPPAVPVATVRPDPLRAAQLGLSARDLLDVTQAVQLGLDVGQTYRGPLPIPLRVRLASPATASSLSELLIPVAGGGAVSLARVAELRTGETPGVVQRRNAQRRLIVGFNVRGADLGTVVSSAQARIARDVTLPQGQRIEWGGQYENLTAASERLAVIIPFVLFMIIGVLTATFHALRPALLVFSLVPFAGVGGVIALALGGLSISLPAAIGFIALSGIAVMNGVVWMAHALELQSVGLDASTIATRAALSRARPVLMTALVAALGFVPMMLSQGIGAEVQRPLATVVVGGLVSSTLLTLFLLPTLYPWLMGRGRHGRARDPASREESVP